MNDPSGQLYVAPRIPEDAFVALVLVSAAGKGQAPEREKRPDLPLRGQCMAGVYLGDRPMASRLPQSSTARAAGRPQTVPLIRWQSSLLASDGGR